MACGSNSVVSQCYEIDHNGRRLKIETAKGVVTADQAIITLPSTLLADKEFLFAPALPEKTEAARGLPLGLADKAFLSLDGADEFERDTRLFGRTDTSATATYQLRPFGWPLIEVYFGGDFAWALESEGEAAFFAYAQAELKQLLGAEFARRVTPVRMHRWGADPFARGSYSYALPGKAGCRAILAEPVDEPAVFCRRGLLAQRFFYRAWRFSYRRGGGRQVIAVRRKKRI